MQDVLVPTSIGELLDKITILEIKRDRITDPAKLANVRTELEALETLFAELSKSAPKGFKPLVDALRAINLKLWIIEDEIRDCERARDFGEKFVQLARAVYFTNDERATVKKKLNVIFGSRLVEEKSYTSYM